MERKFKIDFFELSFLIEACIPPRPIARAMFWKNVINKYYHQMTQPQRNRLFEWMNKNHIYTDRLNMNDPDVVLFNNRFDPNNQYTVTTNYNGKIERHKCFLHEGRYHISETVSILEDKIIKIRHNGRYKYV